MSGKLNFKDQTFWKAIMKEHHACLHGRSRLCLNDGRCPAKTIYIPFAKTLTVKMQGNIENDQPFVSPLRYCMCVWFKNVLGRCPRTVQTVKSLIPILG